MQLHYIAVAAMSTARTKSNTSSVVGSNHLLQGSEDSNQQHLKPKRKAPARPGSVDKSKSGSSSNKGNAKVKRKTSTSSLKEESLSGGSKIKPKRKTSATTSPIKEEGEDDGTKAKRKVLTDSIMEESGEGTKDNKLRRIVSPRKEQYSHLLDEMVGCGDMVLLEPLTEDNIIENLKKRYTTGDIYVSIYSYSCACICTHTMLPRTMARKFDDLTSLYDLIVSTVFKFFISSAKHNYNYHAVFPAIGWDGSLSHPASDFLIGQ